MGYDKESVVGVRMFKMFIDLKVINEIYLSEFVKFYNMF